MLGIYRAHMVLQRSIPDSEKVHILTEVLRNLEALIPGSPDVAALRLTSSRLKGPPAIHQPPCSWPPMIRLGYLALRDADWDQPGAFIEGRSLADRIRIGLASGGVWSKWNAERSSSAEFSGANSMEAILDRLTHTAKCVGHDPAAESERDFISAITDAALLLGRHLLPGSAPALLGQAEEFEKLNCGGDGSDILSVLQSTAQGERNDYETFAWTGLNKKQIQEVATILQSALPR